MLFDQNMKCDSLIIKKQQQRLDYLSSKLTGYQCYDRYQQCCCLAPQLSSEKVLPSQHLLMLQFISFLYFFNYQLRENVGQAALPSQHQYTSYLRHTYRNLSFCLHIPPLCQKSTSQLVGNTHRA
jgi:hypothetical protein